MRTATAVSEALGISRQHLWQIETGRRAPGSRILAQLCWLYDIDQNSVTEVSGKLSPITAQA